MKIKAAVLNEPKSEFSVEDIQLDTELQTNEILVKIVATGLCHTDLTVRDQMLPFPIPAVLGHEGSGIVEKIGSSVSKVKVGDHVVMAPASCGKCDQCVSGHPSYCTSFFPLNFGGIRNNGNGGDCSYHNHEGKDLGGHFFGQSSFASYSLVHERNVVKVEKDIPLELLGPLGCGIQTGAGCVLNLLNPEAGESIVIFGVGSVGLSGIMAAKAAGCTTIIAVDIHDNRLKLAKELGATHTLNSRNIKVSETILTEILSGGLHYAFDTTGRNDVITEAISSLRPMGHCVLVMVSSENLEVNNMPLMGKTITYAIEGDSLPDVFIPTLIRLYKQGMFPFDKLVKFYDLKDINDAVEDAEKGSTIKAIIKMPH